MIVKKYICLIHLILILFVGHSQEEPSPVYQSECSECESSTICNAGCGANFPGSDIEALKIVHSDFGIDGVNSALVISNYEWSELINFFAIENQIARFIVPFHLTNSDEVANKLIKIYIKEIPDMDPIYLNLNNIEFNGSTILIESEMDLVIYGGLELNNNSKLIIKTKAGKSVWFDHLTGSKDIKIKNNSDLRIFSGGDIIFEADGQKWTCGSDLNPNDRSHVKLLCDDDMHVAYSLFWERQSKAQYEMHIRNDLVVGNVSELSTIFEVDDNGIPCQDNGTCPLMSREEAVVLNVLKAEKTQEHSGSIKVSVDANVSASDKKKLSFSAGASGAGSYEYKGSWIYKTDLNSRSEMHIRLRSQEYDNEQTWAPRICAGTFANWNFNYVKGLVAGCQTNGLVENNEESEIRSIVKNETSEKHSIDPYYNLYPNPVIGSSFTIERTNRIKISNIKVFNSEGQLITELNNLKNSKIEVTLPMNIDVSGYLVLLIEDEKGIRKVERVVLIRE